MPVRNATIPSNPQTTHDKTAQSNNMSDHSIQVYLHEPTCRDTESIKPSDRFALTEALTTDQQCAGRLEPTYQEVPSCPSFPG